VSGIAALLVSIKRYRPPAKKKSRLPKLEDGFVRKTQEGVRRSNQSIVIARRD